MMDADDNDPSTFQRAKAFATGRIIIEEEDLEEPLWDLEMALLESDVEMSVAERILDTVREKMLGESRKQVETTGELESAALHDALLDVIAVGQFDFEERADRRGRQTRHHRLHRRQRRRKDDEHREALGVARRPRLLVSDGERRHLPGGCERTDPGARRPTRPGAHLPRPRRRPAAVIYDGVEYAEANDIVVVLGDTAGRLHTSDDLMAQLEKIDRVVAPDMTLFVDEAVAGQDAVNRAKEFNDAAEIDGAV